MEVDREAYAVLPPPQHHPPRQLLHPETVACLLHARILSFQVFARLLALATAGAP
jgi:hypothetical protein